MSFDLDRLYSLLPAIYRIRDAQQGDSQQSGPLKALLWVIAEQVAVLEENLAQLYDDQFIETCAEWVVPYIGDLLGVSGLQAVNSAAFSQRAYVANTLGYRQRKGTVVALEQLARDVTGWNAHVVEYFQLLATTQSMHHLRPKNRATPDLRQWRPLARLNAPAGSADATTTCIAGGAGWLARLNTPFDSVARTVDVRHIASARGRYNTPNIGIFLWPLTAYSTTASPAFQLDPQRYLFSPLGINMQLFTFPATRSEFAPSSVPHDVPDPIRCRLLNICLAVYYGKGLSIFLTTGDGDSLVDITPDRVMGCDLGDVKDAHGSVTGWAHMPPAGGKIAIDPDRGRIALPADMTASEMRVTFYYGFSMDMGGGEYSRLATFDPSLSVHSVSDPRVPTTPGIIQSALAALSSDGVVEIADNNRYYETLTIKAAANQRIELRAAEEKRPLLSLGGDLQISGEAAAGEAGGQVTLNGLLITGGALHVSGNLQTLNLRHCTLVPGVTLDIDGTPLQPGTASLVVDTDPGFPLTIVIDHCITGPLRIPAEGVQLTIQDSIIDAPAAGEQQPAVALAGSDDGLSAGPPSTLERSTLMGTVHVKELVLASNCIFTDLLTTDQRQAGCARFSFVPAGSRTPRRHRCQPDLTTQQNQVNGEAAPLPQPVFTSCDYGQPAYAQLSSACPTAIRSGADDGAEMGAFHDVFWPQREANLRALLDEYLRFDLEAGIFYAVQSTPANE